jgi:uncharacterized protein (TIGR02118 family)
VAAWRVKSMIKVVYCITKKTGMTAAEFFHYWRHIHAPLGARIPGLRRFVQSHAVEVGKDARAGEFDGMAELWFETIEALLAARCLRRPASGDRWRHSRRPPIAGMASLDCG